MKRIIQSIVLIAFLSATVSCTRNNDLASPSNSSNSTPGTVTAGNWRVSLFFDDKDETSNFTGYTFEFASGGQLKATKGSTVTTGTWSEANNRFNIVFPAGPLDDLNDNWLIESKTSTTLFLKEDNPSKTDKLQFTKL